MVSNSIGFNFSRLSMTINRWQRTNAIGQVTFRILADQVARLSRGCRSNKIQPSTINSCRNLIEQPTGKVIVSTFRVLRWRKRICWFGRCFQMSNQAPTYQVHSMEQLFPFPHQCSAIWALAAQNDVSIKKLCFHSPSLAPKRVAFNMKAL